MRKLIAFAILISTPALAGDPKYEYKPGEAAAPPDEDPLKLKANATLGMIYVDGNAFQLGVTASGLFGMRKGSNAAEAFVQGAYGRVGTSTVKGGPITGEKTSAKAWLWHLRYDRFFLQKNTAFLLFRMNGDELAGIDYRIEPQVGYARIFYESAKQLFRGELGYTYTYENYVDSTTPPDAHFHSGRLFLYYENKFTPYAQFSEALELLEAFNRLEHFRLMSITSLSSQISKYVALKVNFTLKYNNDPPHRPPGPLMEDQGFFKKVDTILEAVLAVTII